MIIPDLPPIRTAQINFIGPAMDNMTVRHDMLRRGKNNVSLSAALDSEAGAGTHGSFTFGVTRELPEELDYPTGTWSIRGRMMPNRFSQAQRAHWLFDQY